MEAKYKHMQESNLGYVEGHQAAISSNAKGCNDETRRQHNAMKRSHAMMRSHATKRSHMMMRIDAITQHDEKS